MFEEKVSIIITTYNRSKNLKNAIESVLKQSYKNIEIVVVDDNDISSLERKLTETVMEGFKSFSNIKYIKHEKNSGGSVARNTGINNSSGNYISFLDDDDEYYPIKIENEVFELLRFKENSKIAFIMSEMEIFKNGEKLKVTNREKLFGDKKNFLKYHLMRKCKHGYVGTPAFLFRKSILEEVGGFPILSIRQEYGLLLQILGKGYEGRYLSLPTVRINVLGDGLSRNYSLKKEMDLDILYKMQLEYKNYLNWGERKRMKINYSMDLFKYFIITQRYDRVIANFFSSLK